MNKQQLAAKIWESANNMRSKIDASEYKDYILGFIFYKFLSETELQRLRKLGLDEEELHQLEESDKDMLKFVQQECGYFISYNNLYSTWLEKGADFDISMVRDALSAFSRNIDPARKPVFNGIFETLQTGLSKLGTDERSRSSAVRNLIHLIKDIPMSGRQDYDVLGFIYEYLISKFAENAGKKAGEFYTPHEVSQLMSEIIAWHLQDEDEISIYDPTSGSGSLLITIGKAVAKRNGNPNSIKYYAQELKENAYNLTRMNLVMRGILPDNIVARNGDTLKDDWPWFDSEASKDETYEPLFVDAVVSNPPYSQKWEPPEVGEDIRFEYGIAPKSKADYAFLLHDLYHLRANGIMTIVLPHGVLFRGGEEETIRTNLIEHGNIQAVIGLPANIFFGTGIPTIIMVLRKQRDDNHIFFVDSSKHFIKDGKNNKLRACDIRRIVDAIIGNKTIEGFCRSVSLDEIRDNGYNLNIPRYIDSSGDGETWDLYSSIFGGIPSNEVAELNKYWHIFPSLREDLFTRVGEHTYALKEQDVSEAIYSNDQVQEYLSSDDALLSGFVDSLKIKLFVDLQGAEITTYEKKFSDNLFSALEQEKLVDVYAAYQVFSEQWQSIAIDLEAIQSEGILAVRNPDLEIFSPELIQKALFAASLTAIQQSEQQLSQLDAELSELIEDIDEADKDSEVFNEAGDAFVSAELKKAVKAIGKHPEGDFEHKLLQAQSLINAQTQLKKDIRKQKQLLEKQTDAALKDLDEQQIKSLLELKWIESLRERLGALPHQAINELATAIKKLDKKYQTTYQSINTQIEEAEHELSSMLNQLCGNEFDMAAISKLQALFGGE